MRENGERYIGVLYRKACEQTALFSLVARNLVATVLSRPPLTVGTWL